MRTGRDNDGCLFAIMAILLAYGTFAVVFQTALVGSRSQTVHIIHGWPAVWQGLSMLALGAAWLVHELLLATEQDRRQETESGLPSVTAKPPHPPATARASLAGLIGLVGIVLFFALQLVSCSSLREQSSQRRQERREKYEKFMNDPERKRLEEELSRQWVDGIRQQARQAAPE